MKYAMKWMKHFYYTKRAACHNATSSYCATEFCCTVLFMFAILIIILGNRHPATKMNIVLVSDLSKIIDPIVSVENHLTPGEERPRSTELWLHVTNVNKSCPRFVYISTKNEGLGDQLEHLVTGLSLAFMYRRVNVTFVVDDNFGRVSKHVTSGYGQVYSSLLGVPRLHTLSGVRTRYWPREIHWKRHNSSSYGRYMTGKADLLVDLPCRHMLILDIKRSCSGVWCPYLYSDQMQAVVKPLLRESFRGRLSSCLDRDDLPMSPSALNVVWHVRTGDMCLHCEGAYFEKVYRQLRPTLLAAVRGSHTVDKVKNIVVSGSKLVESFFPSGSIENTFFYYGRGSRDIDGTVCSFLSADVLVAAGSTFPAMVSWFSPLGRPVVVEESRGLCQTCMKPLWLVSKKESVRMLNGTFIDLNASIAFLTERLFVSLQRKP